MLVASATRGDAEVGNHVPPEQGREAVCGECNRIHWLAAPHTCDSSVKYLNSTNRRKVTA